MKVIASVSLFIMFIFASSVFAAEPIEEQQALLYYQIPFGGEKKADNTHKFGFRVDRVSIDRSTGQYSNPAGFNGLMKKPAALDFQMGQQGISAFKLHGHDYLPQLVSMADEADAEVVKTEGENGEAGTQENVEAKNGEAKETEEGEKKELLKYSEVLDQTTVGLIIGGTILVLMLTGTGG
jgi:hypothetical protein